MRALSPRPLLFRHEPAGTPGVREEDEAPPGRGRVRCPRCAWEPERRDLWMCSCLHVWNTFDTRGVCPDCSYRWEHTQCLRCKEWSEHERWYEEDGRARA